MDIKELQRLMSDLYLEQDTNRGLEKTILWFISECGELAEIIAKSDINLNINQNNDINTNQNIRQELRKEMADCLAWLFSIANLLEIDLGKALLEKYPYSCSKCKKNPCTCKNI